MSELSVGRDPFEVVADSFLGRFRAGERPSVEEYAARHPELADQIRELLPALVMIEQEMTSETDPTDSMETDLKRLGDYQILREIGHGGMGVVFEAEQISLGRRVALKVLTGRVAADPTALQRFRREAKAAAALHHTNIVPVFEVGREGGVAFYAMQFIQGQGLDQVIDELARVRDRDSRPTGDARHRPWGSARPGSDRGNAGRRPSGPPSAALRQTAEILLCGRLGTGGVQASSATDPADVDLDETDLSHFVPSRAYGSRGKGPNLHELSSSTDTSNSAVLPGGTALSTVEQSTRRHPYFRSLAQIGRQVAQGLAHAHARGIVHRDIKPSNLLLDTNGVVWITDFGLAKAEDDGLTATGDIVGTLRYMAPERFRGEGEAPADIYALGLTLYELLTLRPAFDMSDRLRLIEQIKTEEPPRPRSLDGQIPRDLETIVLKAIDKDPGRRYATIEAMAEDLRRFLADEPVEARRASAAERSWRYARRNPTIASLGGVLAAVLIVTTVASILAASRFARSADRERDAAVDQQSARLDAERANAQLSAAQRILTLRYYASRMSLAQAAYESNDIGRVRNLLEQVRPPQGEPDLRGFEWDYWRRLCHQEKLAFAEHRDSVQRVVYSPDALRIASADWAGRILVWDALTGKVQLDLKAHADRVNGLAFSPDGKRLASASSDKTIKIWDAVSGRLLLAFAAHSGATLSLAFSPDGKRLASGSATRSVKLWDSADGRLIHHAGNGHSQEVTGVAFSPDGRLLASAGKDGLVKLWDGQAGAFLRTFEGHTGSVQCIAFSPDGRTLASGDLDRELRVWDVANGRSIHTLRGHDGAIYGVMFSPDGLRLASSGADQTVRVWDTAGGREVRRFRGHTDLVMSVAYSPDGRSLASSAFDRRVRIWDLGSPPEPLTMGSADAVADVAFSPDGRRIAFAGSSRVVEIRDAASGALKGTLQAHRGPVNCVAFSPDGRRIASAGEDRTLRIWDAESWKPLMTLDDIGSVIFEVVFSPDGRLIAHNGANDTIVVRQGSDGRVLMTLSKIEDGARCLAFSPDGRHLSAGGADHSIQTWELESGQIHWVAKDHGSVVDSVAYSPDGRWFASAGKDQTIKIRDAATGIERLTFKGHSGRVRAIAFSPDGRRLASASDDRTIKFLDTASGEELLTLTGHGGWVHGLAFSPDGRRLASASFDRTVKVWNASPLDSP